MNEKCLTTALFGVANLESPRLGEIAIKVDNADSFAFNVSPNFKVRANEEVIYWLDSSGQKTGDAMSECTLGSDGHTYGIGVESGFDGYIYVKNNYLGRDWTLDGGHADFSDVSNFRSLAINKGDSFDLITPPNVDWQLTTNFNDVVYRTWVFEKYQPHLTYAMITKNGQSFLYIDMKRLIKQCTALQTFRGMAMVRYINIDTYADLGKIKTLTSFAHNPNYSWKLEDFVANKRSVGENSGSGTVAYAGDASGGGVASFNGQQMSSSATSFSWTATTITYNGVTIDA